MCFASRTAEKPTASASMRHQHHDAIAATIERSQREGTRSVVISGGEADTPIDLYRQLGFTDEVYWRATYELELS